jgi:hypothetical protein
MLERVLQRQLEEASVRCVVLESLRTGYIACVCAIVIGGWVGKRRMVQNIESIGTELEILFMPRRKVFEQ